MFQRDTYVSHSKIPGEINDHRLHRAVLLLGGLFQRHRRVSAFLSALRHAKVLRCEGTPASSLSGRLNADSRGVHFVQRVIPANLANHHERIGVDLVPVRAHAEQSQVVCLVDELRSLLDATNAHSQSRLGAVVLHQTQLSAVPKRRPSPIDEDVYFA